jgi:homoserine O-acetyltransferase
LEIKQHILTEGFHLESGLVLDNVPVAYSTYGQLNKDRSNVIVVCHALTANSRVDDWWSGLYGTGNIFDPSKYFILCINNMGSPYGSISPKSINLKSGERYAHDFPFYTLRDTANLHLRLLERLNIEKIHLLIGGSCGGNIAQEIAYNMGDRLSYLVMLCCSAQETPWVISIHESQRIALQSDPTFIETHSQAGANGLRGARAFALPFYRSHPSFKIRQSEDSDEVISDFKAASYVRYQGDKFVDRYDAHCYYYQLNALDTHNIGRSRGGVSAALSKINAHSLCIGFDSDLLIPTAEQEILAQHIPNAVYEEIETPFGHDAFLIELDQVRNAIRKHVTL